MEVDDIEELKVVGGRKGQKASVMNISSDENEDIEVWLNVKDQDSECKDICINNRDYERDRIRDIERDKNRDKERDEVRDRERDEVRDRQRDEVRDRERDRVRDKERDDSAIRELTITSHEGGEAELTVKKVLEVFKRISSIKTPLINSQLALPFNKNPVKDSKKFKEEYAQVKNDIGKIDGKKGKCSYEEEKERRKSVPFKWPESSPEPTGIRPHF